MEEALKRYKEHFGEAYHFFVGVIKSDDEVIEEIDRCIANDARQSERIMRQVSITKRIL